MWWAVVVTALGGGSVSALFAGIGSGVRSGFSFGPVTLIVVGLVAGLATLAMFLRLRKQLLAARTTPPAAPAKTLPSLAQIIVEVRDHNERVTAAVRDETDRLRGEADAKPVKCERCGKEIPKWFSCEMPDEGMEKRSFWLKTHRDLKWTQEQREAFIRYGGFGCMRCAGTAQAYPADGETKEEFTKRVLNTQL
jgi:hypothetical protein